MNAQESIYQIVGEEQFTNLVAAFYRQIPSDPVLAPMYPKDDLEGAEKRLRDFLIYRFGGTALYLQERGHPRLRMRHRTFPITREARDRWLKIMDAAFEQADIADPARNAMRQLLEQVATFLVNQR